MKTRVNCVYKNVCNGCNQKCRSCQLRYAPYIECPVCITKNILRDNDII